MKSFLATLSCVWALACARAAAQSSDVVLLLDVHGSTQAGFFSALQIELGDTYRVRVTDGPVPTTLPERIAFATQLVESKRALATVWIETGLSSSERPSALLYVVGGRAGRALLEVVEAPDTRGLDLERMLSIKLAELLSELRNAPRHPLNTQAVAAVGGLPPLAAEEARPTTMLLQAGPRFELGLGAGWSRVGLGGALATELTLGRTQLALGIGADVYPSLTRQTSGGEIRLSELTPRVFVGASWLTPLLTLALQAGPSWSAMFVRGRTPLGAANTETFHELGLSLHFSVERPVARALTLGARMALQVAGQRLRFDVNEQTVLDRGWLRLMLGVDITFRADLTGTR